VQISTEVIRIRSGCGEKKSQLHRLRCIVRSGHGANGRLGSSSLACPSGHHECACLFYPAHRCAATLLAAAWAETLTAEEQQRRFSLTGDLTAGYQALHEEDNEGGEHTAYRLEARPRIRASWRPVESRSLQAGIAGRFSSLDDDWHTKFY
jgi:hypothetical protein